MVTLKEIAQMCGVTTSTVSNVLNNKPKVGEARLLAEKDEMLLQMR